MDYRYLGRTGLEVSPLCLGAMMFGAWGNRDHEDSIRIIHRALDAGINFIDTADVYSRRRVGGDRRQGSRSAGGDEIVLATKFHGRWATDPNRSGNSRRWIMQEVDNSLRRLQHRLDRPLPGAPARPGVRHRRDARRADRPRARRARCATSAARPSRPHEIVEAQWTAERRGRERFVCEQPPYSLLVRGVERDVLPVCQRYGMGVHHLEPARRRLAVGRLSQGSRRFPSSRVRRASRGATTCRCPRTSASSTRPTRSPRSPRRPG